MFMLTLPESAPREGGCRINGRPAEYRLYPDRIEFRHDDTDGWETRSILDRRPQGSLVMYVCDDGPGSGGPYHVVGLDAANPNVPTVALTSWLPADQPLRAADHRGVGRSGPQA